MTSGPNVRKVHTQVTVRPATVRPATVRPAKSDSVAGGWWPRSRELAAKPLPSSEPLAVRSNWIRSNELRSR
jgi:hypothetical protein